ncbi:N-acetyl-gamma-glutamyl-phosphate reductase [Candidatus Epulonipiscium viviparus]|uniref:N-acetyl-gamma-glutamyl-phosphate reductase n=1 Tax=Candidatus Epulonipiscium viviparus TaxID=420336 RepID=UPI0027380A77|nr:N-acetyl-gamma-glutamyl-phosphate reductase [Candidatus Epulopiscium viviparus]
MKVYIDGSYGTTGLAFKERLSHLAEYEIVELDFELRKNLDARVAAANNADIAITCLPNEATREIAPLITVPLIDTSTEFRTHLDWVYGFSELGYKEQIAKSNRIANPGCHASGFLALAVPLRNSKIIATDLVLSCTSITGYSGGGNKMIADYERSDRPNSYKFPRPYATTLKHKHLKEMQKVATLSSEPIFMPMVADNYSGMCVSIPLSLRGTNKSPEDIVSAYKNFYKATKLIDVANFNDHPAIVDGFLNPFYKEGLDSLDIVVTGNENEVYLHALFDNLGKGAAGSSLQCLNIRSGNNEFLGLKL